VPEKKSDYVFHPPSGGDVPGKVLANPFINYPPQEIRKRLEVSRDKEEREKLESALKQWERLYQYPGYPYRTFASCIRTIVGRMRMAEIVGPAQNLNYYQDMEVPEGLESILDSITYVYDQYDMPREDYNRQGERPSPDAEYTQGDFTAPSDPVWHAVDPRGAGPNPEGMEIPEPATGGDIESWPDGI